MSKEDKDNQLDLFEFIPKSFGNFSVTQSFCFELLYLIMEK